MYGRNRRSPSPPTRRGGGGGVRYQILIKNIPFDIDWKRLKDFIKVKYFEFFEKSNGTYSSEDKLYFSLLISH